MKKLASAMLKQTNNGSQQLKYQTIHETNNLLKLINIKRVLCRLQGT